MWDTPVILVVGREVSDGEVMKYLSSFKLEGRSCDSSIRDCWQNKTEINGKHLPLPFACGTVSYRSLGQSMFLHYSILNQILRGNMPQLLGLYENHLVLFE